MTPEIRTYQEVVRQVSGCYPSPWKQILDSAPDAQKPDYEEQLQAVNRKLIEMGTLVSANLNQLIRDLGGEGASGDRQRYEMVSRGVEDALRAYTTTAGSLESRARSLTDALCRTISYYPPHIADIFAGYTPIFSATNDQEVVLKEANIKGYALKQEWMIGLALKRREEGLLPLYESELVHEARYTLQALSYSRALTPA